jgi:hypothetical protein
VTLVTLCRQHFFNMEKTLFITNIVKYSFTDGVGSEDVHDDDDDEDN